MLQAKRWHAEHLIENSNHCYTDLKAMVEPRLVLGLGLGLGLQLGFGLYAPGKEVAC